MLTNRTIEDVEAANALKARGAPFSESEVATLERGTFTLTTITRIANATAQLRDVAMRAGYLIGDITDIKFGNSDLFCWSDLQDLIDNAMTVKDDFFHKQTSPENIQRILHFAEINKLEQLLQDMQELEEDIGEMSAECGSVYAGG